MDLAQKIERTLAEVDKAFGGRFLQINLVRAMQSVAAFTRKQTMEEIRTKISLMGVHGETDWGKGYVAARLDIAKGLEALERRMDTA